MASTLFPSGDSLFHNANLFRFGLKLWNSLICSFPIKQLETASGRFNQQQSRALISETNTCREYGHMHVKDTETASHAGCQTRCCLQQRPHTGLPWNTSTDGQVSSSSSAGRDWRLLVQAHMQHSPSLPAHAHSQIPWAPAQPLCPPSTPCPDPSPSHPPHGSLAHQLDQLSAWCKHATLALIRQASTSTPNLHVALLSLLKRGNYKLQSSNWACPKLYLEFLNGPSATVWRLLIFGIVIVIPCHRGQVCVTVHFHLSLLLLPVVPFMFNWLSLTG